MLFKAIGIFIIDATVVVYFDQQTGAGQNRLSDGKTTFPSPMEQNKQKIK